MNTYNERSLVMSAIRKFPPELKIVRNAYFVKDIVIGKALSHLRELHGSKEIDIKLLEPLKRLVAKQAKNSGENIIDTPIYAQIIYLNSKPQEITVEFSNKLDNSDGKSNEKAFKVDCGHHHHGGGGGGCGYDYGVDPDDRIFTADEISMISANEPEPGFEPFVRPDPEKPKPCGRRKIYNNFGTINVNINKKPCGCEGDCDCGCQDGDDDGDESGSGQGPSSCFRPPLPPLIDCIAINKRKSNIEF